MSTTPIAPVVTTTIVQSQAQLDPSQLQGLLEAIKSASILQLPNGADISSLQSLSISILPNGSARLNVATKN